MMLRVRSIRSPFFMFQKCKFDDLQRRNSLTATAGVLRVDGPCVVFAVKLTLCQKIFDISVGNIISLVNVFIKILKFIGIDLSSFWFPMRESSRCVVTLDSSRA